MEKDDHWSDEANCRTADPEGLFGPSSDQKRAKSVCTDCRVRLACLAEALDNRIEFGVWGGMTERERRTLLRRRPHVGSWLHVLRKADPLQDRPRARSEYR
ncbi:WhiB family transcriptional regulator [Streptomyces sp. ms191]|uniref:WhiB family transcriptional regulator n=1 Tax=unclassified Streptomyces TaxID=2593676 RepID=UPI0011CEBABD|nr:WhiB family transcriptional regulator [Streptomyces sp. ms191]